MNYFLILIVFSLSFSVSADKKHIQKKPLQQQQQRIQRYGLGSSKLSSNRHLVSVYDDYDDATCTRPLSYDGVCPDYLQGGCRLTGGCDFVK